MRPEKRGVAMKHNPKLARAKLTEVPPYVRYFLVEVVKRSLSLMIRFIDDVEAANRSSDILDREGYVVGKAGEGD
jgi:hypothetical protein